MHYNSLAISSHLFSSIVKSCSRSTQVSINHTMFFFFHRKTFFILLTFNTERAQGFLPNKIRQLNLFQHDKGAVYIDGNAQWAEAETVGTEQKRHKTFVPEFLQNRDSMGVLFKDNKWCWMAEVLQMQMDEEFYFILYGAKIMHKLYINIYNRSHLALPI